MLRHERPEGFEFAAVVRIGIGVASIATGVMHLTAASAHAEHAQILAFFVGTGVAQIIFGTAVLTPRPARLILRTGALANAGLIAVWLASRMSGLPFIEGADHAEPVGVKDTATVALELLVVAGALALVTGGSWLATRVRFSERTLAPLAAATALLIVPGIASPAHVHSDSHHHGTDGHGGGEHVELAAGHTHTSGEAAHAHVDGMRGTHTHVLGNEHSAAHGTVGHEHARADSGHHAARSSAQADITKPPPVKGIKAAVRYGPFVLPPSSMGGEAHYNRILNNIAKPCSDCYLVKVTPNLVYADGSPANLNTGAMLHHAVWTRPAFQDMTCGRSSAIGSQGSRFFASGNERTVMALPEGFGYYVGTDSWTLIAEIMNHSDQAKTLYVTLDVVYRPASDNLKKITPVWMDVDNCGDSQYAVPAGKSNTLWTWPSTITGRVVSTAGHVHDGGVKTVLSNETTKQQMCTSAASYGTKPEFEGSIESMSMCVWDRLGTVRKGETLGLRAYYDISQPADDVMGIMIAAIYETNDLSGGSPPPAGAGPQEQKPPPTHDHDGGH